MFSIFSLLFNSLFGVIIEGLLSLFGGGAVQ